MIDFEIEERVVCVSDKRPCCETKIPFSLKPTVGEVYTVKEIRVAVCSVCFNPDIAIRTEATLSGWAWPQQCFKKLPPKVTTKNKKTKTPILTDA